MFLHLLRVPTVVDRVYHSSLFTIEGYETKIDFLLLNTVGFDVIYGWFGRNCDCGSLQAWDSPLRVVVLFYRVS